MRTRSLGALALLPTAALAIAVLFLFQQARFFAASVSVALVELRGVPVPVAMAVIGAVAVGALVAGPATPVAHRRSVVIGLVIAGVLRVLLQLTTAPLAGLVASGAGIVACLAVVSMAIVAYGGRLVGAALLLGAIADVGVMGARHTLDLTRSTGGGPTLAIIALAGLAAGFAWAEAESAGHRRYGQPVPPSAFFLIGPWAALHLLWTGNLGVIATVSGLPFSLTTATAMVGLVVALGWSAPGRSLQVPALAAGVVFVAAFVAPRIGGAGALVAVIASAIGAAVAMTSSLERETTMDQRPAGWAFAAGAIAGIVTVGLAEAAPGGQLGSPLWAALLGTMLVMGAVVASTQHFEASARWAAPAAVGFLALLVPLWLWSQDPAAPVEELPPSADPSPSNENPDIVILTYDLDHGFNAQGRLGPAAILETLAGTPWRLAALQEVPRGQLRHGGLDLVAWLGHRIDQPIAWESTGGPFDGTALVTDLPVALNAPIAVGAAGMSILDGTVTVNDLPMRVFVVDDPAARAGDFVPALLDRWASSPNTLLVGDFGPDSERILAELVPAPFFDAAELLDTAPETYPALNPAERRDAVLVSGGTLAVSAIRVIESAATDHRPIEVRVVVVRPEDDT